MKLSLLEVRRASNSRLIVTALGVLFALSGCGPSPRPPIAHRQVRIDALLPLHPSWAQVISLDRETARIQNARFASSRAGFAPPRYPPLFTPRDPSRTDLVRLRSQQIDDDSQLYLANLEKSIDSLDASRMVLERKREQTRVGAEIAQRLAEKEQQIAAEIAVKERSIDEHQKSLVLRSLVVTAHRERVRNSITVDREALRQADAELALIQKDINSLADQKQRLVNSRPAEEAAGRLGPERAVIETQSRARLDALAADMLKKKQKRLQDARREQVQSPVPEMPNIDAGRAPFQLPAQTLNVPQTPLPDSRALAAAAAQAQRARIVEQIRKDIVMSVRQLAQREGWEPDLEVSSRAPDATKQVAQELKAEWNPPELRR